MPATKQRSRSLLQEFVVRAMIGMWLACANSSFQICIVAAYPSMIGICIETGTLFYSELGVAHKPYLWSSTSCQDEHDIPRPEAVSRYSNPNLLFLLILVDAYCNEIDAANEPLVSCSTCFFNYMDDPNALMIDKDLHSSALIWNESFCS
jgi:hypothetical protein